MEQAIPPGKNLLQINCEEETDKITKSIKKLLSDQLKRRGIVVGLSGGIDSSVTLALCQKAIGSERVIGLLMPEQHSSKDTLNFSQMAADRFGVQTIYENITPILHSLGFYEKYNAALQNIIPDYGEGWQSKIVISNILQNRKFTFFSVIAISPDGREIKKRLDIKAYLGVVSATNFKQRTRKMLEYYHADRLNYAVAGTPNRLEYDQGFFVKNGDGASDIKPIAHLYKTQVYQIAGYLGVPEKIINRPPTTDTYSLLQNQDEFYFSLPYEKMDICLYGKNNNISPETVSMLTDLTSEEVKLVYTDIEQKRSSTKYLHLPPLLVENIPEICPSPFSNA